MSYESALVAAGCEVLEFEMTGSYQGDWYALVKSSDCTIGVVRGSYGSCSYCDAFEGEFGYRDEDAPDYKAKLKDFGMTYLPELPIDLEIANLEKSIGDFDWGDEREAISFMKTWKIKYNL
jgi:hypothetical protein